jgi:hypothetical protein
MICEGCQMREMHERYLKDAVEKIHLCPDDLEELASAKERGFLVLPRSRQRADDLRTAYGAWCSAVARPLIYIRRAAGREASVTVEMWPAGSPLSEEGLQTVASLISDGAVPGREGVYVFPGAYHVGNVHVRWDSAKEVAEGIWLALSTKPELLGKPWHPRGSASSH